MDIKEIRFVSSNGDKLREAAAILGAVGVRVKPVPLDIKEIQTEDLKLLVRDKALKAFKQIGRPLFVEHTGLYLDGLNGLPGGLTQIFWTHLKDNGFADLVGKCDGNTLVARCIIGYCDMREIHYFTGEIEGSVPPEPRGGGWDWDSVFIPSGETQTFAEMGDRKQEISMRRQALLEFAKFFRR